MSLRRIYEIVQKAESEDTASRIFDGLLIALIFLNVLAIMAESFDEMSVYAVYFRVFEIVSVIVFTVEFCVRLATARYFYEHEDEPPGAVRSALRWFFSPLALVDLIAILPFYIPLIIGFDLRFVRMIRILRLLRILKLQRYYTSLAVIATIFREKKEDLVTTVFLSLILLVIASTFMYYIENDAQPDAFPNILATLWWAVATLTTVGYGDVYPVTAAGKFLAGFFALLGVGVIALPTGILSAAFIDKLAEQRRLAALAQAEEDEQFQRCPHCGKVIDDA